MAISNTNIIRGYAKAIFDIANCYNHQKEILLFLEYLSVFIKNPRVIKIINNNELMFDQKASFLLSLVNNFVQFDLMENLIKLLSKNKHLLLVPMIYLLYQQLYLNKENKLKVLIISAIDLNDQQKNNFQQKLAKSFNKEVIVEYQVDPSIIAGIIIKYQDEVIDYSLKKKLLNLELELLK